MAKSKQDIPSPAHPCSREDELGIHWALADLEGFKEPDYH